MSDALVLWYAEEISQEQVKELREELRRSSNDPAYHLIVNFTVGCIEVPPGAVVMADNASPEQIEELRSEIDKALEDPDYVPVVPFAVEVLTRSTRMSESEGKTQGRCLKFKVTIEQVLEFGGEQQVYTDEFEFDPAHIHLSESRPIARLHDDGGDHSKFVPSPWAYMTISGILKPNDSEKAHLEDLVPNLEVDWR
jgi:hypothetical protein